MLREEAVIAALPKLDQTTAARLLDSQYLSKSAFDAIYNTFAGRSPFHHDVHRGLAWHSHSSQEQGVRLDELFGSQVLLDDRVAESTQATWSTARAHGPALLLL